jgi:hypothetical protein
MSKPSKTKKKQDITHLIFSTPKLNSLKCCECKQYFTSTNNYEKYCKHCIDLFRLCPYIQDYFECDTYIKKSKQSTKLCTHESHKDNVEKVLFDNL